MSSPPRKVALVTGGAVRLGRALSLGLAEANYEVAVHYHRSATQAREVEQHIAELGCRGTLVSADLTDPAGVEEVAGHVRERHGRLDLLVNSAASFEEADLLDVDAGAWDEVMALNLRAPFLLVRETASLLRASRGAVVNILDLGALEPWTRHPHHAVSKAGLLHLTRILARVLAPEVRVNAVVPGSLLPPAGSDSEAAERDRRRIPLARLGSPEDLVGAVLFLAGAPFVTGEVLVVDGGRRLRGD